MVQEKKNNEWRFHAIHFQIQTDHWQRIGHALLELKPIFGDYDNAVNKRKKKNKIISSLQPNLLVQKLINHNQCIGTCFGNVRMGTQTNIELNLYVIGMVRCGGHSTWHTKKK